VWKLYRSSTSSHGNGYVLEKMYSFDGCTEWVTKMICEPSSNRIYAIRDNSCQVLNIANRSIMDELDNIHDSPLNCICWYERNQFYITGCRYGWL